MQRASMIQSVRDEPGYWDFLVVGGGATGLGIAVDAASRGFKTLLLEMSDFARGTSSRSTKLVHGGVRYLQQGNLSLVLEALRERGLMIQNAPHLVHHQSFVVPNYDWWEGPFYGIGLKVYDMLAGRLGLGPSRYLSLEKTRKKLPNIITDGLRGGVIYYDGQFEDARLAISLARTAAGLGATLVNYMEVTGLLKDGGMVQGVTARDTLSGEEMEINSRVVVNATGVFADRLLQEDDPESPPLLRPSQGIHIVVDKKFLPGQTAIMVPHTEDGRVLFAVPWYDKVILGTTDTPVDRPLPEPLPLDEEIEFVLKHAAMYLNTSPLRSDVLSVFAGLRPLVRVDNSSHTASLSRDHTLLIRHSGLVTISGGKWTTYRKMAQDAVDQAAVVAGYPPGSCITGNLRLHGYLKNSDPKDPLNCYGSDKVAIRKMVQNRPEWGERLHADLHYIRAEVIWAVRHEMAMTVEDVLSRRTRALLLDARASMEIAPEVARWMAQEAGYDSDWEKDQVAAYVKLAKKYIL